MRKLFIALLSACLSLPALATTVTSTKMVDALGNPLASGTATFRVLDAGGHAMSVKLGGGGQVVTGPVSVAVVNGAFSAPNVVDVSLTAPSFPCVQLVVTDNATGDVVWEQDCLQPTGAIYSLDLFSTNTTPVKPQAGDTIEGDLNVNGNFNATGNFNIGGLNVTSATITTLNNTINPANFGGSDIGAKVNAAFATLPGGSGTVDIPDGIYNFSTSMVISSKTMHLKCGPGVVLNYTGSTAAIVFDDQTAPGNTSWTLDGENGCYLNGSGATSGAHGVFIIPSNGVSIVGMKIEHFTGGAGIYVDGADGVSLDHNNLQGNEYGIYTTSAPATATTPFPYTGSGGGYATNALHIHDNEIAANQWGFYSHNAGVPATRELGVVIHDNTFEAQSLGDIRLGWDANTTIETNYFESAGVAIQVAVMADNAFNINIAHNYFTVSAAERAAIELGNGFDFHIKENYYEGGHATSTGCLINVVPDPNGGNQGVIPINAFSLHQEGGVPTPNEYCANGVATAAANGTQRIEANASVAGNMSVGGALASALFADVDSSVPNFTNPAQIVFEMGPISVWEGSNDPSGSCITSGTAGTYWISPHGESVCQDGVWVKK